MAGLNERHLDGMDVLEFKGPSQVHVTAQLQTWLSDAPGREVQMARWDFDPESGAWELVALTVEVDQF